MWTDFICCIFSGSIIGPEPGRATRRCYSRTRGRDLGLYLVVGYCVGVLFGAHSIEAGHVFLLYFSIRGLFGDGLFGPY